MLRSVFFAGLLLCATPAAADVTGRYRNGTQTIRIEVDEAGAIRVGPEAGRDEYTLFEGDEGFVVSAEGGETVVIRLADLLAVLRAQMAALFSDVPDRADPGREGAGEWQPAGRATVEGRTGTAYRFPGAALPAGERIVLTEDPRLAPLGLAWSRALTMMPSFAGILGLGDFPATRALGEMLETRGPLQLGAVTLVDVSFEPIEPRRFALPAAPLSREAVAARMQPRLREDEAGNSE